MVVKRKEKALEESTPKIKKITKTIKKIVSKNKKSSKNESESEEYDDVSSIASTKTSLKTSEKNFQNSSLKYSSPQEKAFRKKILLEMESKGSKELEARIAEAIKSNRPRIAFDPGGNSLTGVTDQYEYIKYSNNNVIDKKLKMFKVNNTITMKLKLN